MDEDNNIVGICDVYVPLCDLHVMCFAEIEVKESADMRSSTETYREVAERCSAYEKKCSCKGMSNDTTGKSCLSCSHFTNSEYCELDLYDPIAKNL